MAKKPEEKEETPNALENVDGTVVKELADSINERFQRVSDNQEKKGFKRFMSLPDSSRTILLSIEKSMFVQTEFLSKISNTLENSSALAVEKAEDLERAESLSSVNEKNDDDDKTGIKETLINLRDTVGLDEPGSFIKKLALAMAGGLAAAGFIKGLVRDPLIEVFKDAGLEQKTAENATDATGVGTGVGVISAIVIKTYNKLFGKKVKLLKNILLPSILAGGADFARREADDDELERKSKDLPPAESKKARQEAEEQGSSLMSNIVDGLLFGFGTFGIGKLFGGITKSARKFTASANSKFNQTKGGGNTGGNTKSSSSSKGPNVKPDAQFSSKPPSVKPTVAASPPTYKMPNPGRVSLAPSGNLTPQPNTISGIASNLSPEKLAKYSKFFKFAGIAGTVIPALIDPALAIYNDAPQKEVNKQLAGALGSVGGVTLGMMAGGSIGAAMGFGTPASAVTGLIGGGLGAIVGGMGGEWLIEKIVDAIFGDEVPEEEYFKFVEKKKKEITGQLFVNPQPNMKDLGDIKNPNAPSVKVEDPKMAESEDKPNKYDQIAKARFGIPLPSEKGKKDTKDTDIKAVGDDVEEKLEELKTGVMTKSGMKKMTKDEIIAGMKDKSIKRNMGRHSLNVLQAKEQRRSRGESTTNFENEKVIPNIVADPSKEKTEDGKIPAKIVQETATPVSAELQAAQDKTTASFQAIEDFEQENASTMTKEDRGNGMYAPKFSDPEKQKEYNALFDQAMMDKEAEEREQALEAVDRGGKTEDYTRTGNLTQFRDEEAGSLSALKNLQSVEKEREDFMSQMGVKDLDDIQDPMMKEKAKGLRTKHATAKKAYRKASTDQLGSRMDSSVFGGSSNYMDRRQTLMTQYGMNEEDMNKLGIVRDEFGGSKDGLQTKLEAFKRQKEEEKLEMISKGVTGVAGIETAPEKLLNKARKISQEKATQDSQGQAVMMQNLNSGGNTSTQTNVGGDKTTIVANMGGGGGGLSLSNSALPVSQSS